MNERSFAEMARMQAFAEMASGLRSLRTLKERNAADRGGYMHCTRCGHVYVHPEEDYGHRCKLSLSGDLADEAQKQREADAALGRIVREWKCGRCGEGVAHAYSCPGCAWSLKSAIAEALRKGRT